MQTAELQNWNQNRWKKLTLPFPLKFILLHIFPKRFHGIWKPLVFMINKLFPNICFHVINIKINQLTFLYFPVCGKVGKVRDTIRIFFQNFRNNICSSDFKNGSGEFIFSINSSVRAYFKSSSPLSVKLMVWLMRSKRRQPSSVSNCLIWKEMVEYCIRYAKEHGYSAIRLDVVPDKVPARKLYEKCGFQYAGDVDLERGIEMIPVFSMYEFLL